MHKRVIAKPLSGAVALAMALCVAGSASAQRAQKNVVFDNIPGFLRLEWDVVLQPTDAGKIVDAAGTAMTGNADFLFTTKPNAKVLSDFREIDSVLSVVQYNLPADESDTGFITIFQLRSPQGDVLLYPGPDGEFWTVSIRFSDSISYISYVAILPDKARSLRELGNYRSRLETERRLLAKHYRSLAEGLDP
jgi:hypothetical protein